MWRLSSENHGRKTHDMTWPSITQPETNSLPPKMDGWNTTVAFGIAYFQGRTVSFPGCIYTSNELKNNVDPVDPVA